MQVFWCVKSVCCRWACRSHMLTSAFAACVVFRGRCFGCAGSPFPWVFLWLWRAGPPSGCCVQASSLRWPLHVEQRLGSVLRRQQLWRVGWVVAGFPRLQSTGSAVVAHELSCSAACGIFGAQGLNPCLQCWQEDSYSLTQQGSPCCEILKQCINCFVP